MIFSASISSSVNQRGRDFVRIPEHTFNKNKKWAVSWLMKETPGFHVTSSAIMGQDNDGNDATERPNIWISSHNPAKIRFRDQSGDYWQSTAGVVNRSASNHFVINYDGTDPSSAKMSFYENGGRLGNIISRSISSHTDSGSFNIEALGGGYRSTVNTHQYSGSLGQVMFFDHMLTTESIQNLNNNPEEGINPLTNIQYNSTYTINENEFKCTVNSNEFNFTNNVSVRRAHTKEDPQIASFATSSYFKPYVTTVGLYNDNNELLAVGKLGQPVRMSDETDTTFVIRWDS